LVPIFNAGCNDQTHSQYQEKSQEYKDSTTTINTILLIEFGTGLH
jgi:hypothetical protein